MKNTKKILTAILIALFFLTTALQIDAFARSPFKKAVRAVAKPVEKAVANTAKAVTSVLKPIANVHNRNIIGTPIKGSNPIKNAASKVIAKPIKKTVGKDIITPSRKGLTIRQVTNSVKDGRDFILGGIGRVIGFVYTAVTDWKSFGNDMRRFGYKAGLYNYSDRDFIKHVSGNEKIREALWLLHDKTPDIFRMIKQNVVRIETGSGRGHSGFARPFFRYIRLDEARVNKSSVAELAGLIVHEASHINHGNDNFAKLALKSRWKEEFRADAARANALDRLGAGAWWKKLDIPGGVKINDVYFSVTDELRSWKQGDRLSGGYWREPEVIMARGIVTHAATADYTISIPSAIVQVARDYTNRFVEIDYSADRNNPTVKQIGENYVSSTIWLDRNGVLKKSDKTKDSTTNKETILEVVIANLNAWVYSFSTNPELNGNIPVSIKARDAAGNAITAAVLIYSNGNIYMVVEDATGRNTETLIDANGNILKTTTKPARDIVASPVIAKSAGVGATIASYVTVVANPASLPTSSNPNQNTQVIKTDAAGRPIEWKTITKDSVGSVTSTSYTTSVDYANAPQAIPATVAAPVSSGEYRGKFFIRNSANPLPPVGGPQGGIAPDVVNPNQGQVGPAVTAGGK